MKDERLLEAFNAWQDISQTPDTVIAYHSRLKLLSIKKRYWLMQRTVVLKKKGKK